MDLIEAYDEGIIKGVMKPAEERVGTHENNDSALRWAAFDGDLDVVKYLIDKGADIHANDDNALKQAASRGHLEVVKYLVEKGANIHADNNDSLRWAASNGHLEVVKYLVEQGADIHAENEKALRWAVRNGHLEVIKYLIEAGADVRKVDFEELVSGRKYKDVLYLLLDRLSKEELLPLLVSKNSEVRELAKEAFRKE